MIKRNIKYDYDLIKCEVCNKLKDRNQFPKYSFTCYDCDGKDSSPLIGVNI